MVKGLVKLVVDAEKYTVRVLDELVHKQVQKGVEHYEKKGINRTRQAASLTLGSALGYLGHFGAHALYEVACYFIEGLNKPELRRHSLLMMMQTNIEMIFKCAFSTFFFVHDVRTLPQQSKNNNGAIAQNDLPSYKSFKGIARPYLLTASLSAMGYGLIEKDITPFVYGATTIPYALSLYVRDDQSGGLLEKVGQRLQNQFRTLAPIKAK